LNGKQLNGRKVKVEMAKPRTQGKRQREVNDETVTEASEQAAQTNAPAVKKRQRKWRLIARNLSFKVH